MSYYTDQRAARQQAAARKQYNKQLIWFIIGVVVFILILGIVGHFEFNDLAQMGQ